MVKNVNGELYSDLITSTRPEVFWNGGERPMSAIKYIVIHGTATTRLEPIWTTWSKGSNRQASANYVVADNQIIGCLGENFIAWHSGGVGTITNTNSIGVEHLNSSIGNVSDPQSYLFSEATIETGAMLVAEICKRLGIVPSSQTIVPHRSVSATSCPQSLDMGKYIEKVQSYYNGTGANTENKNNAEEENMITISAEGRGIALVMGGRFLPILDPKTPTIFWGQGVKHYTLDTKTFDAWQGKADKSTLDDETVNKLIAGLK